MNASYDSELEKNFAENCELVNKMITVKLNREEFILLHLGCGDEYIHELINIDISKNVKTDICADITNLPFPFESVDGIYMKAVFEHMYVKQLPAILRGWLDLLKPGGWIKIDCIPDFERTMFAYIRREPGNNGSDQFDVMNVLGYGQGILDRSDSIESRIAMLHKGLYNRESLIKLLENAGFSNINATNVTWADEPVDNNINVEAFKAQK